MSQRTLFLTHIQGGTGHGAQSLSADSLLLLLLLDPDEISISLSEVEDEEAARPRFFFAVCAAAFAGLRADVVAAFFLDGLDSAVAPSVPLLAPEAALFFARVFRAAAAFAFGFAAAAVSPLTVKPNV